MTGYWPRECGCAIDAFEALAGHYIDEGADEKAVRTANRLLALDPLQEGVHRTLMRLYVKRRQPNSALRQYRARREILERELGVPPELETHRLYREILESRGREEPSQQAAAKREPPSIDALASSPSPVADSAGLDPASATAAPAATPTRELRQATVMFADLSRFTQLRGSQYAATDYRKLLAQHGLVGSMGRRGNPYDNAKAESFIKTLKVEAGVPDGLPNLRGTSPPIFPGSSTRSTTPVGSIPR